MIFGSDLDEIVTQATDLQYKRATDIDALRGFVSDLKTQMGRQHATRRTSLKKALEIKQPKSAEQLSPQTIRAIVEVLENQKEKETTASTGQQQDAVIEDLDAYYAQEVIAKLEKIVRRASGLQSLDPRDISNQDVREYFEEAHRCFLYGFPIATAVLCRALLESALKEVVDPEGKMEQEIRSTPAASYFEALVRSPKARLTDDRPACAIRVRNAGNDAIHNRPRFERRYSGDKASEIIDDTRKVLLDLYGSTRLVELE